MDNVIILTHGISGSSVVSALLAEAGYWIGSETRVKPVYDTFENSDLVGMNERLLAAHLPDLKYEYDFRGSDVRHMARQRDRIDFDALRAFVAQCDGQGPWLWKDPRLTWTIRLWAEVLPLQRLRFLVLTREPVQAWVSANVGRHVQGWRYTQNDNGSITQSNLAFLREAGLPFLKFSFEDLLLRPEPTLEALGRHLDLSLSMEQLQLVCRLPLYRRSKSGLDFAKALAILIKNFGERDGRGRLGRPAWATLD